MSEKEESERGTPSKDSQGSEEQTTATTATVRSVPEKLEQEEGKDAVDFKFGKRKSYDPNFRGPIKNRGCTDIICLLLLILFIAGWGFIAMIGFKYGDPGMLVYPVDSLGQKCGYDEPVKDKKYLYFFDITKCAKASVLFKGCVTPQVCVEKCPDYGPWSAKANLKDGEEEVKKKLICKYGVDKSSQSVDELIAYPKQQCASYVLPSKSRTIPGRNLTDFKWRRNPVKNVKSALHRRCIPNISNIKAFERESGHKEGTFQKGVEKLLQFLNAKENFEYFYEDLRASWVWILGFLVMGALISLIWIFLMRFFAGIMVWVSLIGMIIVLTFSCYFSVTKYLDLRKVNETIDYRRFGSQEYFISEEEFTTTLDTYLKLKDTWLAFSIITGVLLAVLLLVVIGLRSRLTLAVALIKQGARAVGDMTFTLFWPIVPWILQFFVVGWFVVVGIYIATASEPVFRINQDCTCSGNVTYSAYEICKPKKFNATIGSCLADCAESTSCDFAHYRKLSNALWFHLYNFFGLLWLLCFINDLGDMVLAGSFAGWYWTRDRKKLTLFPVSESFTRTLKYHLGTIAFGSLIISTVKFIRYILEYIDQKTKEYQENPVTKGILWCMKCCFWCLEKFLKFLNRNAYIMVAVHGKNFCSSARDAFFLLMRNAVRAFVLDKVSDFLLFIGKLVVTGVVAIASFYIFTKRTNSDIDEHIPELHFNLIPVILITVGTYFITSLFFSVYEMAVDTLFLCFLEDCEMNDGTPDKPYFMPKDLMKILGQKNELKKQSSKVDED